MYKAIGALIAGLCLGLAIGVRITTCATPVVTSSAFDLPGTSHPTVENLKKLDGDDRLQPLSSRAFDRALQDIKIVPFNEGNEFRGYLIVWLREGSIWEKSGLKSGDIIEAIDGKPTTETADVKALLESIQQKSL